MFHRGRVIGVLIGAIVLGSSALFWARSSAQPTPASSTAGEGILGERDLVYSSAGGESLKLDLARPSKGDGPFPAVVCLHGGGWVGGDRKQMAQTLQVLAKRGYVAVAPDYRLAPKHPFPACIEDCKAAVRWLRANAGKYRIDPDRIGATGPSAGAHLACLLGVTESGDGLDGHGGNGDRSSAVQCVVAFGAPLDLADETVWTKETLSRNLIPLFAGEPRTKMDLYRKASPMHYSPRSPAPVLLVHGSDDPVIPVKQARDFTERISRNGGKAHLSVLHGAGHTWQGENLLVSIDKMLSFLDENLKR